MKVTIEPLDNYISVARENETELLEGASPLMSALRRYHEFFVRHVFSEENAMPPIQVLMALHSQMIYLSSIRTAMSGHGAATFPLFRTALEAACYAFLIGDSDELQTVWLKRNSTPEALKLCRKKFGSPVRDTARRLQEKHWNSSTTEEWINQAYDAAIDFGAHPNPKAVWPYVHLKQDDPAGYDRVSLVAMYESSSPETLRCLVACLDYGLLIAIILSSCNDGPSEETVRALNEMIALKEEVTKDCFPAYDPK